MKILIIESDDGFAGILREAMEARGLEVESTSDGKAGVELARRESPAAIVLAVELGDKITGGYTWCQKLKKDDDLKKIPLVLISSQATQETFEQHKKLKNRAEEYLIKPFESNELLTVLANHVALPEGSPEEIALDDSDAAAAGGGETFDGDDDLLKLDEAFDSITDEPKAEGEQLEPPEIPIEEKSLDIPVEEELAADSPPVEAPSEDQDVLAALGDDDPPEPTVVTAPSRAAAGPPPASRPTVRPDATRTPGPAAAMSTGSSAVELAELKGRITELEAKLENAERQLSERAAEAEAVKTSGGARDKEYFHLKSEAMKKDKEILRLKEEASSRERETLELREQQTELEQKVAGFEGDLAKKDALIKNAQQKTESAVTTAKKAESTMAALKAEASQVPELSRQIEELTSLRESLVAERDRATSERESVSRDLDTARTEVAGLQTRVGELEMDLASERDRANVAEGERDQLRADLESTKAELESTRGDLESTRGDLESTRSDLESTRSDLESTRGDLESTRGDLESTRSDLETTRNDLDTSRATAAAAAAAASAESDDLHLRISELETESARNEERAVKAYQKIKGDERVKEKTKKALAIALQLLEEHGVSAAEDDQART